MFSAAYLFDLDGVLTPTALVHQTAWAETFNQMLALVDQSDRPFEDTDYLAYVDGRPRYDGVRSFLQSRNIDLPEGAPSDPPGFETVQAVGNLKNDAFRKVLQQDGIAPYPDALELLNELDSRQIRWAVVSSSANAKDVLAAAGLADRTALIVDAVVATAEGLAGKPRPDTFLYTARLLGLAPSQCAVVEDAISGVQAGKAGGFGEVIGVARHGDTDFLAAGADRVVGNLAELIGDLV
ncbi:MAG: HAD family hydrolase [Acidimicrobiia bacterium]